MIISKVNYDQDVSNAKCTDSELLKNKHLAITQQCEGNRFEQQKLMRRK